MRSATQNNRTRNNLTWSAVATAPSGFCRIKSSMVGTLLQDIVAGSSFADISCPPSDKMHPLQYQRPQAAPSAGNIAQAEKTIEVLKSAGSLERRFARLEEIELIWSPAAPAPKPAEVRGGVFSHIAPKGKRHIGEVNLPTITMTWDKFQREVLPTAQEIEFYITPYRSSYIALVTAVNLDAPPILQWDTEPNVIFALLGSYLLLYVRT